MSEEVLFNPGSRALLILMGQRFLVTILEQKGDSILVSYPTSDFPVEGMYVDLEFHDERGYTVFASEVLRAPREAGDGLLLKRPSEGSIRNAHRSAWRIPVELMVTLKHHVHPRRVEARALNLSAGGLLLQAEMDAGIGDNVDLKFTLPGETTEMSLLGTVMHLSRHPGLGPGENLLGLRFLGAEPSQVQVISRFIWQTIRELDQNALRYRRRATDSLRA